MRVIGMNTKYRVIELFLTGYTLDEIAEQLDISKGSVVSIVSDFREGKLQLPGGELRLSINLVSNEYERRSR